MPPDTVGVARPSRWGNPFRVGSDGVTDNRTAVQCYRDWIEGTMHLACTREAIAELRGKNLACWCKLGEPCHADVLLELANDQI